MPSCTSLLPYGQASFDTYASCSHVLCNLYQPIPTYTEAIQQTLKRLQTSVEYVERMCDLAGPCDREAIELASGDIGDLRYAGKGGLFCCHTRALLLPY